MAVGRTPVDTTEAVDPWGPLHDLILDRLWDSLTNSLWGSLGALSPLADFSASIWGSLGDTLWDPLGTSLWNALEESSRDT